MHGSYDGICAARSLVHQWRYQQRSEVEPTDIIDWHCQWVSIHSLGCMILCNSHDPPETTHQGKATPT
jgi:hypothetical protein